MRIQHNIMAMNAYRNYNNNTSALSKNLEKLSSGYKINRAGDDAAGLAISEKMRAQITGLNKAQDNAKDGISLVQTAEGALTEVHDMLNRMYELAEQSANGTYEDETDRLQLEKEVNQLKAEIDRIADSANFNGIQLLDGSLAKADGVTIGSISNNTQAAILTGTLGAQGTNVNGVLTEGVGETQYSAKFYVGDITNNNAAAKNIVFNYKDNAGATKTVTLAVDAGAAVTTQQIADALKTGTGTSGDITITDNGTAFDGTTKAGNFNDLYDVSVNGNIITITAKASGASGQGEVIDGSQLGAVSVTNTFDTDDVDAAEKALSEKYNGAAANVIDYGSAAGRATDHVAAVDGNYQVASSQLTLTAANQGADFHNMGITVGDVTYIIKSGTQDLSADTPAEGTANGKTVKYITVGDTDTATQVGDKLAAAITADEGAHGIVATNAGDVLTISESTRTGQEILDGNATPGIGAKLFKLEEYTVTPATSTVSGEITLDADSLRNGTTIQVGDKSYMLTSDPKLRAPDSSTTVITFADGADSDTIAKALADQLTADGVTNVTASADGSGKVTFTDSEITGTGISATGAGLVLQIGDTSDSYNQLQVTIKDTHVAALGLDDMSIANQDSAAAALDQIKDAINYVSDVRGTLGATQNRLDHTINNLSVMEENIQDAESTIRDTDVAEEMMEYTKNNILIQSAQAMLAQANQVPQGVLQLLQ